MFVAWTTTSNRADADRLATGAVEARLAACAQIDGPITSHYYWEGKLERAEEFRVSLFAQTLGTVVPVSDKRLEEAWRAASGIVRA